MSAAGKSPGRVTYRDHAEAAAKRLGYFWLPCPLCGEHFGGHEGGSILGHRDSIPDPDGQEGMSRSICRECTAAGKGCAAHAARDGELWHDCEPAREALPSRKSES